tara:strand:+ start:170 stop:949 length:780 start_codon:yes stop_codon:yes gene_type:complete
MGVIEWPASGAAILAGWTYHARRGGPDNAFRYGVDYVLWRLQPEATARPALLRRNGFGLLTLRDRDHGHGEGSMLAWAKAQAEGFGMPTEAMAEVWLLTQPRSLGFLFNPVSFWFFRNKDGDVRAVLAEVNNTFGDRHSYLCALPDWRPLTAGDQIAAQKVFHVSPFQQVEGTYTFRFDLQSDALDIVIDHRRGNQGLVATLSGALQPAGLRQLVAMIARRPLGALRVYALIHWQAVKLKLKGARYRVRPPPPQEEVTR